VSERTKSLHRHDSRFRERMTEEMGLHMFPENRYWECHMQSYRDALADVGHKDYNIKHHIFSPYLCLSLNIDFK